MCVSCSLQPVMSRRRQTACTHARSGDLKKVSDHSRCGDCGENNQQQEIKYLSMLIIAARGVGAGKEAGGLQRADRRLL